MLSGPELRYPKVSVAWHAKMCRVHRLFNAFRVLSLCASPGGHGLSTLR